MTARSLALAGLLVAMPRLGHADDKATADAAFQKQVADTNAKCGTKFTATIDWKSWDAAIGQKITAPVNIGSSDVCGMPLTILKNELCTDDAGKAAAKTITSYRCEWSGKNDGKHSFDKGVLLASQSIYADLILANKIIPDHFPLVYAGREIPKHVKEAEGEWQRDTKEAGASLTLDIDVPAFAAKQYPEGVRLCIEDLRTIVRFLHHTYGETENKPGRALLAKLKHARCSVGDQVAGAVTGDTLTYTLQARGKAPGPFMGAGEGWAWGYNFIRASQKLGGKCAGSMSSDASPACEKAKGGVPKLPKN